MTYRTTTALAALLGLSIIPAIGLADRDDQQGTDQSKYSRDYPDRPDKTKDRKNDDKGSRTTKDRDSRDSRGSRDTSWSKNRDTRRPDGSYDKGDRNRNDHDWDDRYRRNPDRYDDRYRDRDWRYQPGYQPYNYPPTYQPYGYDPYYGGGYGGGYYGGGSYGGGYYGYDPYGYDSYNHRQDTKNEWRNIALAAGAIAILGLLQHDNTLIFSGAAGALYSLYRYDQDSRSQDALRRARARYFSMPYFYRDGVRYNRMLVVKEGEKFYQFVRVR